MFYDENLMNDEILGVVWKLANNIPTENIGNHNLPRICTELNSWVDIAVVPHRRLSLRTSSTLINGTAMLYQQNMRQLLDDVIKLDEDLVQRRRRKYFSSSSSSDSSESTATPEEMRLQPTTDFDFAVLRCFVNDLRRAEVTKLLAGLSEKKDSSFSPTKRPKLDRAAPEATCTPNITMSQSSSDNLTTDETTNTNEQNKKDRKCNNNGNCGSGNGVTVVVDLTGENCMNNIVADKSMENQRKDKEDKEVQTSPISVSPSRSNFPNCQDQRFDPNLPFGCILIHDSYQSRIPSRIVFTSLNSSIRNLK
ncbi:hypothetical protein HF086_011070 [Spodoptera exigua]|uniref:Rad21/Rec8-like protein N-terminal domain-containing protein n=1 Tax=Spodoptera exigua TaxID=7107 RepID=A0A922M8H4_SPOEX|nr:hypothetical protein HF086_011070 [Spodoptera exigua]